MPITKSYPLPALTDVDDNLDPHNGDVLTWRDTEWIAATPGGGGGPSALFVQKSGDVMTGTLALSGDSAGFSMSNSADRQLVFVDQVTKRMSLVNDTGLSVDHLLKAGLVTPTTGWVLTWNGTEYVAQALPPPAANTIPIRDLSDVDNALGTTQGRVLSYDSVKGWTDVALDPIYVNVSGDTMTAGLIIRTPSGNGLVLETGSGTGRVVLVDMPGKTVQFRNGTKTRWYTDEGTTETAIIDGATGAAQFDGAIAADAAITCTALTNKTGNYTASASDQVITCDATAGPFTITLPAVAATLIGKTYKIKKTDSSNNVVTIDPNASETIDGKLTYDLTGQYTTIEVINNGSAWLVIRAVIGSSQLLSTVLHSVATSSAALSANTAYLSKVDVLAPIVLTKLSTVIGTPSGNGDLGIYRQNGTTLTRIASSGTTPITASSAAQTFAIAATTLYPGFDYYFAIAVDNITAQISRAGVSGPTSFLAARNIAFTSAFVLPSSLTVASGVASGNAPVIVGTP